MMRLRATVFVWLDLKNPRLNCRASELKVELVREPRVSVPNGYTYAHALRELFPHFKRPKSWVLTANLSSRARREKVESCNVVSSEISKSGWNRRIPRKEWERNRFYIYSTRAQSKPNLSKNLTSNFGPRTSRKYFQRRLPKGRHILPDICSYFGGEDRSKLRFHVSMIEQKEFWPSVSFLPVSIRPSVVVSHLLRFHDANEPPWENW